MKHRGIFSFLPFLGLVFLFGFSFEARALDLDWSGQFRSESHWVYSYAMNRNNVLADPTRLGVGGYYIPGGGNKNANFQSLFMKLRPSVVVNDNVYLKTEWWLGNPIYGFFGDAHPQSRDQRQWYSSQSRGSTITAQRFWAEILTDVGTVKVGRQPLDYGLGLVWNAGNDVWSRYMSTADAVRLSAKFGSFTFSPAYVRYTMGNSVSGGCISATTTVTSTTAPFNATPICTTQLGHGNLTEYSLMLTYDNPDEDMALGVNFLRRLSGAAQDPASGVLGPDTTGTTYGGVPVGLQSVMWDIYGKKSWGPVSLEVEIPIVSGTLGAQTYKAYGVAVEGNWETSKAFDTSLRFGRASGQPSGITNRFRAFYFHPNYRLGLIMFNYQLRNFAGPNTQNNPGVSGAALNSPFDNPIVNAQYLSWTGTFKTGRWKFHSTWSFADAMETAVAGQPFYNTWEKGFYTAASNQSSFLGWEMDYGVRFDWDEMVQVNLDFGWYFPGSFYKFSNTGTANQTGSVFALVVGAGVSF